MEVWLDFSRKVESHPVEASGVGAIPDAHCPHPASSAHFALYLLLGVSPPGAVCNGRRGNRWDRQGGALGGGGDWMSELPHASNPTSLPPNSTQHPQPVPGERVG